MCLTCILISCWKFAMNQSKRNGRLGKYEVGRTIGEGTFAKVQLAKNLESDELVALKILDKEKILKHNMQEQIMREVETMKRVNHPNIVRLHEVMGTKTKIYIVMELVTGGDLLEKIVKNRRIGEDEARIYFQQLINSVDYCHCRGVYHRDLKPENLLLDERGILKVSDFGLSVLSHEARADGLFRTTCGTPHYVAPEVIRNRGYDGAKSDVWSCGVILFIMLAGYLPFDDSNLVSLFRKISSADYTFPPWISSGAVRLMAQILDPNPRTRITIPEIMENNWFKKGYKNTSCEGKPEISCHFSEEFRAAGDDQEQPILMNAFGLISFAKGLNLANIFAAEQEARFISSFSAKEVVHRIEKAAKSAGISVHKNNHKMKLEKSTSERKRKLQAAVEIYEVWPSHHIIEMRVAEGEISEFQKFCKNLSSHLQKVADEAVDELRVDSCFL